MLEGRNILVCVSGGIAAFKSVLLVRALQRGGANVRVVMSRAATKFVGTATYAGLTGEPPVVDLWDFPGEIHVELGEWADVMVVAPATMNLLSKLAQGRCDDALSATLACAKGPIVIAPAMHTRMWDRPSTQRNVSLLRADGVEFVGPVAGLLASGASGIGRMSEPDAIAATVARSLAPRDLAGKRFVISAGPTLEDLDPVRFLGNRSTGRMGYALASAAARRGAEVVLVSGPTSLAPPHDVTLVPVRSARDMRDAVLSRFADIDVLIMAAAVADYRPSERADQKLKKGEGPLSLSLVRNPDILANAGELRTGVHPVIMGFAVETEQLVESARGKLVRKKVDFIAANLASDSFGRPTNRITLVSKDDALELGERTKSEHADALLDAIATRLDVATAPSDPR